MSQRWEEIKHESIKKIIVYNIANEEEVIVDVDEDAEKEKIKENKMQVIW